MTLPFCSVFPEAYGFNNYNIPYLRIALTKLESWRVIKVVISMIPEFHLTAYFHELQAGPKLLTYSYYIFTGIDSR